jgi:hypothetical protein
MMLLELVSSLPLYCLKWLVVEMEKSWRIVQWPEKVWSVQWPTSWKLLANSPRTGKKCDPFRVHDFFDFLEAVL